MKKRHLFAICAVVIIACGFALAQQPNRQGTARPVQTLPPAPSPSVASSPPASESGVEPAILVPQPARAQKIVKPEDMSIEQLIEVMEKTQAEIAELEKANQARFKVLQDKVVKVKERMGTFNGNPGFRPDNRVPLPQLVPTPPPDNL